MTDTLGKEDLEALKRQVEMYRLIFESIYPNVAQKFRLNAQKSLYLWGTDSFPSSIKE
jgi:hypothetical protein